MRHPPVSVVIVSRGRPETLVLCLTGVAQLCYPAFEIVVVADPAGLDAARSLPFVSGIKTVHFDQANISAARNAGVAVSAGEIIAFIDDDAVPEPTWLLHLTAPFTQVDVAAAGGYVRGRNGISYQWKGRRIDAAGSVVPLALDGQAPRVFNPAPGTAIKTEGTNMAVRRAVLVELGGFDPAFRFYLDETDLNVRLARARHATAIVPMAQVHHGFAASSRRRGDRVPTDLSEIGASWAVFLRKHLPANQHAARWQVVRAEQRRRGLDLMVQGRIEPRDVRRLMAGLDAGYAEGARRSTEPVVIPSKAANAFCSMPGTSASHSVLCARAGRDAVARRDAQAAVARGGTATVIRLSYTALFHRARFHPAGYWEQWGGQFGKSLRNDPVFRFWRFEARCAREEIRIAAVRRARDLGWPFAHTKPKQFGTK